jgi:hypothetical protein
MQIKPTCIQILEKYHNEQHNHFVDQINVERLERMHQDFGGMQALLCLYACRTETGHGGISEGVRSYLPLAQAERAAKNQRILFDFRQFDVRPVLGTGDGR